MLNVLVAPLTGPEYGTQKKVPVSTTVTVTVDGAAEEAMTVTVDTVE